MRRLLVVWLVLSGLTLGYLVINPAPGAVVATGAIVIALVKVRLIFREFMEVRHAPVLLRRLTDVWVLVIGVSLLGSYLLTI